VKNKFIDGGSARDIDGRIDRILKDLGYTSGTVRLLEVRQLLKLDIGYYTADDPGLAGEIIHKLRIGARQVIQRPGLLIDAIKRLDLKALFLPDRKRILIDGSVPDLKKRWSETHEIAHSVIPWHAEYMLGDTRETLSPSCHETIEAEANYGAGRLLFPSSRFGKMAQDGKTLSDIRKIAAEFGNTITSSLWRWIEQSDQRVFGLIGEHPKHPRPGESLISYFIRSRSFVDQFAGCDEQKIFEQVKKYCGYQRSGPVGNGEVIIADQNGNEHVFAAETFANRYNGLTLGTYVRPRNVLVQVPGVRVREPNL
jgi:hypothetical protein